MYSNLLSLESLAQPKQSLIDLNQDHLNQDGLKGISTVKQSSIKAVAAKINRLLLVTLSFFLVTNCTPTFSTKSADRTQVSINLSHLHSGPGIKVDYQFSHPVTEFLFEVPAPRIRGANWVLKTPDTIFTEQSAVSAQPTRRLVFEIHPDQTVLDSMDPGMYVLDNGIVFDLDYLPGAKALYETSLIINAPGSTFISTSHDVALSTELFKIVNPFGLAYLGDSEPVDVFQPARFATITYSIQRKMENVPSSSY